MLLHTLNSLDFHQLRQQEQGKGKQGKYQWVESLLHKHFHFAPIKSKVNGGLTWTPTAKLQLGYSSHVMISGGIFPTVVSSANWNWP